MRQRLVKMRSRSILLSAMKRAHSSMPMALKVGAHVEGHVAALADVAGGAPGLDAAHRGAARRSGARAVERERDALAAGEVLNCLHRILLRCVYDRIGAEVERELEALGRSLDGDDARAHCVAEQGRRKADRALSE